MASKTFGDAAFNLTGSASSSLAVTYVSSNTAVAIVSGTTVTIVGVGSTNITASQAGNTNYNAASNVVQSLSVGQASQTITFSALASKAFGDAAFNLTGSASSSLAVTYVSSNIAVATVSGSTVTIVGASATTISASQVGDGDYEPAPDVDQSLTVNQAPQTITFGSLASARFGDANFSLSATASSGLSVSYASSNTDVATVSGNTVTIVGAGSAIITASQTGDTNYNAASDVMQSLTVNQAAQSITFGSLTSQTFGDATFDLTATASSGLSVSYASSNSAVATISGDNVTIVGAGSTNITASQSGNTDYNSASDVIQSLTINKADQMINITSIADKIITDSSFDMEASVNSGLGLTYDVSGPANISGTTITLTGAIGTVTVTVSQAGTTNYNSASEQITFEVNALQSQIITFATLADKIFGEADFPLTATASSGLAVTYTSSDESVATVSGSTVTVLTAGSVDITASQSGDDTFNEAMDVTQTLTVNRADQAITFSDLNDVLVGATVDLVATTTSELAIVFEVAGPATLSGNTLTTSGVGTVTVTASQPGDNNNNEATDLTQSFEVIEEVVAGLEDEIGFKVYPNPVQSVIRVEGKNLQALQIMTLTGKLLDRIDLQKSREVNLYHLMEGFYILRISTKEGQSIYRRILKTN